MYVFGDCHIGANRRNKFHHRKGFEAWRSMVLEAVQKANGEEVIMFAGDLWDSDRPTPQDLVLVKETLEEGILSLPNQLVSYYFIPGNHDRLTLDGVCAANIFDKNIEDLSTTYKVYTEYELNWKNRYDDRMEYCFLPYSADILEKLKEISDSYKEHKPRGKVCLVSHFTTAEMNPFAGIISEEDPVFDPFDVVILGDCHIVYDHNKFHTTGSTYMFNVDEMYSKRCVPSYLHIDDNTGEVIRFKFEGMKPIIINSEDEATDDDQLYLIVTSDVINVTKPNVFIKYKPKSTEDNNDVEITESVEIRSINKDKVFEIMYPELTDDERRVLKMYANNEIDIEDVISNKFIHVIDKTGPIQITEVELEAEMEGFLEEDF